MTTPANLRGWGQGWPVDRSDDMRRVAAFRSGTDFDVHYEIAPLVKHIIDEIERRGYLLDHGVSDVDDDWSYSNRPIRGRRVPSNHSWGLAIDIDAQEYPMGTRRNPPRWIIDLFALYRFDWGGVWSRPDPMHFEFNGTPREARWLVASLAGHHLEQSRPPTPATVPPPYVPPITPGEPDMVRFLTSHPEYGSRLVVISDDQGYRESGVPSSSDADAFAKVVPSVQLSPKALQELRAVHQASAQNGRVR